MASLVSKGVFSQQEAANVMIQTANDTRSGTEDDATAADGEAVARGYEMFAAWLLGHR
jgi:hypothetical protein